MVIFTLNNDITDSLFNKCSNISELFFFGYSAIDTFFIMTVPKTICCHFCYLYAVRKNTSKDVYLWDPTRSMVLTIAPATLHFGAFSVSCPLVCVWPCCPMNGQTLPPPMQSNYRAQNNVVKMCPLTIKVGNAIIERLYKYAQVTYIFSIALSRNL